MYLVKIILLLFLYMALSGEAPAAVADNSNTGQCFRKHSIPLNEQRFNVQKAPFTPIHFMEFEKIPAGTILHNTGRTLVINIMYKGTVPSISMGPFEHMGSFRFDHIYWHWLELPAPAYRRGMSFPAEIHLVFYNANYSSLQEASGQKNAVTILAYSVQTNYQVTTAYDSIMEELVDIREPKSQLALSYDKLVPLLAYISTDIEEYWTYHGSWTSHICFGDVIWIDFVLPLYMTQNATEQIKNMRGSNNQPLMSETVRVQTPNGVILEPNNDNDDDDDASGKLFEKLTMLSDNENVTFVAAIAYVDAVDMAQTLFISGILLQLPVFTQRNGSTDDLDCNRKGIAYVDGYNVEENSSMRHLKHENIYITILIILLYFVRRV